VYLDKPSPVQGRSAPAVEPSLSVKVEAWVAQQPQEAWQTVWIRHSTQGNLKVQALQRRVWVRERTQTSARHWHLIVTRDLGAPTQIKYSLSNAPASTSAQRLAQMQRQRFWIERTFQEAKNEAGMDEYPACGWQAWYHHIALVMMAMLFGLQERLLQKEAHPLISAGDVKILLARTLPRRDLEIEELLRQMKARHRQRKAASESAARKQRRRTASRMGNLTK